MTILDRRHEFELPLLEQRTDSSKRLYITPSGVAYPSVSTVVGSRPMPWLNEWRARVGEKEANRISKKSTSRGTKMHALLEYSLIGDNVKLEESLKSAMPDAVMMYKKIWKKMQANTSELLASEARVFSDSLEVAGTLDCIIKYYDRYCLTDFKNSIREKREKDVEHYFMQTAAYAVCWNERTGMNIQDCLLFIANESGGVQTFHAPVSKWLPGFKELRKDYSSREKNPQ